MSSFVKGKLTNGILLYKLNLDKHFSFNGVVFDFETTGIDANSDEIICGGFVFGNRAWVIVRTKELPKEKFYKRLARFMKAISKGRSFYAYNARFEREFAEKQLGLRLKVEEIMNPAKGVTYKLRYLKGRHKLPKLRELLHPRFFHYFGFSDWDVDGGEIVRLWREHRKNGDLEPLNLIAQHNLLDVLSELELLVIWNPFIEEFLNHEGVISEFFDARCDVCGTPRAVEELAVITYPERKDGGSYRFVERRVCKDCLKRLGF